jgi:hypothetical protein
MKWSMFIGGFAIGAVITAGAFVLLLVPKTHALEASVSQLGEANKSLASEREQYRNEVVELRQKLGKATSDLYFAQMPEGETPEYTLLYDPAPAGSTSSAAQLLDLVRPGLGATLAKLQDAARQGPYGNPRWLIPGYAKPVVNGNPQGFYYQWANLQTGEIETHSPKGTTVTGAN